MPLSLSQPNIEPIPLEEARRHCHVDETWDMELADAIASARNWMERRYGYACCAHTVTLTVPATQETIKLPMPPFRGLVSADADTNTYPIVAIAADGTETVVADDAYTLDTTPLVPTLTITSLPADAVSLRILYRVGYLYETSQTQAIVMAMYASMVTTEATEDAIILPAPTVQSVTTVASESAGGTVTELADTAYNVNMDASPPVVTVSELPVDAETLVLTYRVGYSESSARTVVFRIAASTTGIALRVPSVMEVTSALVTLDTGDIVHLDADEYTANLSASPATWRINNLPEGAATITVAFHAAYAVDQSALTGRIVPDQQRVVLSENPLYAVNAVFATVDGTETVLDDDEYTVATVKGISIVTLTPPAGTTALEVLYATGTLPEMIRGAMRMLTGYFFRDRDGSVRPDEAQQLFRTVDAIAGLERVNAGVF